MSDANTKQLVEKLEAEDPKRRTLALALLGAVGGTFLQACTSGDEVSSDLNEMTQALSGSGVLKVVDNATNLRALTGGTTLWIAVMQGYGTAGDDGGGVFYWSTTAKADDGWSALNAASGNSAGWRRVNPGFIEADNVTMLRACNGATKGVAVLAGYSTPADGGGGTFHWSTTSAVDDGGTIFNAGGIGSSSAGWRRVESGAVNAGGQIDVKWFGAGIGVAPDTSAINRAYLALVARGGGVLYFPKAPRAYQMGATLMLHQDCPITIKGDGWTTRGTPTDTLGSVIQMIGGVDFLQMDAHAQVAIAARDIAIAGPGLTGSSSAFNFNVATSVAAGAFENLLIFAFPIGINLLQGQTCSFYNLALIGCGKGLVSSSNDIQFYGLNGYGCGTAVQIIGGGSVSFVGGVLEGANAIGLEIFPAAGTNVANVSVQGMYFEGNGVAISFNTSNYNAGTTGLIQYVSISDIHASDGSQSFAWAGPPGGVTSIGHVTFTNCYVGFALNIPSYAVNFTLINNIWFGGVVDAGYWTQRIGDQDPTGYARTNLTAVTGLSTTYTPTRNLTGKTAALTGLATTGSITLPQAEVDAAYIPDVSIIGVGGGAPTTRVWVTSYTNTQINYAIDSAPGAGTVTLGWRIFR